MTSRKLLIGAVVVGGLALGWVAWRAWTAPVPPNVRLDGVEAPTAHAVRDALDAVRRQPRSGETWGELAMTLAANGFYEHLPHCYDMAERFDPDNAAWPYLHGLYLLEVDPRAALALLQKALPLTADPEEQAVIHFRLAQVHIENGQLEEADKQLKMLGELEPQSARLRLGQGLLALAQGDRSAARAQLKSLTGEPFARKRATTLLAGLADKDSARTLQAQAAKLPEDQRWPDPLEARMFGYKVNRLSRLDGYYALDTQGRHDEALDFLRKLVADAPDAEVCFTLGYALYKSQELEEAEKAFRAALGYDPSNVKTHFLIASCLLLRAEKLEKEPAGKQAAAELFRKAVQAADETLAMQKEHGLARLTRGWALKHLGRTEEALQDLRQALLILPEMADTHLYLGETLAESGKLADALPHLQNAVRFARPDDRRPSQALAKWTSKAADGK